jgi:beta-phosphoglucomutase family hydrolase
MRIEVDPKTKALIFDIDGTLADSMEIHYKSWAHICREHGFHYPKELFYELAGIPTRKIIPMLNERLGTDLNVDETVEKKEEVFMEFIHEIKPIEVVVDVAKRYHGLMPMSLGTGSLRKFATKIMEAAGIADYFDIMVCAEDVTHHKPHPETFLKCAELMKIEPEFCQVFEDGEQGLAAGRSAGMIVTDVRPYLK